MSIELINKLKKLQNAIIKRNNMQFKKDSVEILNPEKVEEDLFCAPVNTLPTEEVGTPVCPDCCTEEPPAVQNILCVEAFIRKSIAEEQEAAAIYIERAFKCIDNGDFKLARLFEELACDEIVHAASLETALDMYGMFDPYKFLQGQAEAEYLLQEAGEDIVKQEEKAREKAEKARKEFDFVDEYSKDKAAYKKEQIVNSINDLILGKACVDDVVDTIMKNAKASKKGNKKEKKAE